MPTKYQNIWYIIATHRCETPQNEEEENDFINIEIYSGKIE